MVYFTIINENGIIVGTAQTFSPFRNVEKGKSYHDEFSFDISNIAAGNYYFQIDIFELDDEGHHLSYDHPNTYIQFEITDSHPRGLIWQNNYFGFVSLNPINVIKR